jgi:hypothetical protein
MPSDIEVTPLDPALRQVFAGIRLFTDARPYALVSLPPDQMRAATILFGGLASPFAAWIVDKDEITIVMHEIDWTLAVRDLPGMRVETGYRLISFDLVLDLNLVGFLSTVCRLLSEAGIAVLPIGAFSRDHILVRASDAEKAWQVLSHFIEACK